MNGDAPVASYSVAPVELVIDGVEIRTALSMTTMTHPDWQGRGLFPRLATEAYAEAERLGIAGIWGFPNAKSHPIFVAKLGWADVSEIPTLLLDLAGTGSRRFEESSAVERDDEFARTYPGDAADGLVRVRRTREYLSWRYARHPLNRYQVHVLADHGAVSSYVVTKVYGSELDLVDIQCSQPDEARALISHVAAISARQSLNAIRCWAPLHHWIHGVLERLGFEQAAPITYLGGRTLCPDAFTRDWLDYRNWYVQMGDSDVY